MRSTGTVLRPRPARIPGSDVTSDSQPASLCIEQATGGGIVASGTRIPKAELTGIYGKVVKRMSRKMFGDVAEPVEVAWHNRKVLNFSFSIGRKAQKWDRCDANRSEER